jgi:hypothetical protein
VPPAIALRRAIRGAQFVCILFRRSKALREGTSNLCRNLSQVVFEIFQQNLCLIARKIGKRRPHGSCIGRHIARLLVTCHDRCSSRSGDG